MGVVTMMPRLFLWTLLGVASWAVIVLAFIGFMAAFDWEFGL